MERKFTNRLGAPSAITGVACGLALFLVGSSALAQDGTNNDCGVDVECDGAGEIFEEDDSDTFGPEEIENRDQIVLSVDEFDVAAVAAFHGVPEADIDLLKAELSLGMEITEWTVGVTDVSAQSGCNFDWNWSVSLMLNPNAQVGTPSLATPPLAFDIDVGHIAMGAEYAWDFFVDGGGIEPSASDCYADTTSLDDWTGNGSIDFTVVVASINQLNGCSNAQRPTSLLAAAEVEVVYTYCVEDDAECFLVIGSGRGMDVVQPLNYPFGTQVSNVYDVHEVLTTAIPEFVIPEPGHSSFGNGPGMFGNIGLARSAYRTFAVEVLMYNPEVYPNQPEHHSNGLFVYFDHYGNVASVPFGSGTMSVWAQTGVNAAGKRYVKFPFTIPQ